MCNDMPWVSYGFIIFTFSTEAESPCKPMKPPTQISTAEHSHVKPSAGAGTADSVACNDLLQAILGAGWCSPRLTVMQKPQEFCGGLLL